MEKLFLFKRSFSNGCDKVLSDGRLFKFFVINKVLSGLVRDYRRDTI